VTVYAYTGSNLTTTVTRDTNTGATTYTKQTWTVGHAAPILVSSYVTDIRSAGDYRLKINGTVVATVNGVAAAATNVTFTPAAPVELLPGTDTFEIECTSGAVTWYARGNLGTASPVAGVNVGVYNAWGWWQEPASGIFVPGVLNFKVADVALLSGIDHDSLSSGSFAAQTWSVTLDAPLYFFGLLKRLRDADATGYVLSIDAVNVATIVKNTSTTIHEWAFVPAAPVLLAAGAHTFKITPSANRRWLYDSGTTSVPSGNGSSHTTAWGNWTEASTNKVSAQMWFRLPDPPGVPTSVAADPGTTSIVLTWAAPATGDAAEGYEVRIDGGAPIDVGDVLTHTFTGLDEGTEYAVSVRAYNDFGDSAWVDLGVTTETTPPTPTPRQHFDTADLLRLEVEGDPPAGKLRNLIANPNGEHGGSGWVTPSEGYITGGATMTYHTHDDDDLDVPHYFASESFPVKAGDYLSLRIRLIDFEAVPATKGVALLWQFAGPDGNFYSGWEDPDIGDFEIETAPGTYVLGPTSVPEGMVKARLVAIYIGADPGFDNIEFDSAAAVTQPTDDEVDWDDVVDSVDWVDVLEPTHEINVTREALNVGVLTATILSDDLDPATETVLRPGRPIRLMALDGTWQPVFTGKIAPHGVTVRYDLQHLIANPNTTKTARISLTAVDALSQMQGQPRPYGIADIDELTDVLEGCGLRWNVNGSADQCPPADRHNRIDSANAVDQVAITRDTRHGYAWIDREGVFQAHDTLDETVELVADDTVYSDLVLSYDSALFPNTITVVALDYVAGEGTETRHGPFVEPESYYYRGERTATFTVNADGLVGTPAEFAAEIFTPLGGVAVESIRLPMREETDTAKALIDLYAAVTVQNVDKGIDADLRVTGITHRITPRKWLLTFTFAPEGAAPRPQIVPTS
jgi:hypothetical protein